MRGLCGFDGIVDGFFAVAIDTVGDENNDVLTGLLLQNLVRSEVNRIIERSAATPCGVRIA